uniref:Uncharacterized protein n=1 Tax=Anopheles maculatus TaxID=74869 RepID=A0A182SDG8_9DIPT
MYVIFPADELILLTYGIAVPRVPPRPTLDNLREPLVPTGSRPTSTTTTTTTTTITSKTTNTVTTSSTSNATSSKHASKSSSTKSTASKANTSTSTKKANDSAKASPPITSTGASRRQESGESYELDDPTGTALADASELATFIDDVSPRNGIPATAAAGSLGAARGAAGTASPKGGLKEPAAGAKSKSKLQLKLGRLRPHSSIEQNETASRVREDLHIHVSNPVFTRDNLRQRNFDAFFESGEQVYSLEVREKPTPRSLDALGSSGSDPGLADAADAGLRTSGSGYDQRPSSLGFFRKPKSPLSIRSKSAEHEFADVETSQKGDDRCP